MRLLFANRRRCAHIEAGGDEAEASSRAPEARWRCAEAPCRSFEASNRFLKFDFGECKRRPAGMKAGIRGARRGEVDCNNFHRCSQPLLLLAVPTLQGKLERQGGSGKQARRSVQTPACIHLTLPVRRRRGPVHRLGNLRWRYGKCRKNAPYQRRARKKDNPDRYQNTHQVSPQPMIDYKPLFQATLVGHDHFVIKPLGFSTGMHHVFLVTEHNRANTGQAGSNLNNPCL
jgi:hypothetical protein